MGDGGKYPGYGDAHTAVGIAGSQRDGAVALPAADGGEEVGYCPGGRFGQDRHSLWRYPGKTGVAGERPLGDAVWAVPFGGGCIGMGAVCLECVSADAVPLCGIERCVRSLLLFCSAAAAAILSR